MIPVKNQDTTYREIRRAQSWHLKNITLNPKKILQLLVQIPISSTSSSIFIHILTLIYYTYTHILYPYTIYHIQEYNFHFILLNPGFFKSLFLHLNSINSFPNSPNIHPPSRNRKHFPRFPVFFPPLLKTFPRISPDFVVVQRNATQTGGPRVVFFII